MTKKQWIMEIEHLFKKDETNNLKGAILKAITEAVYF